MPWGGVLVEVGGLALPLLERRGMSFLLGDGSQHLGGGTGHWLWKSGLRCELHSLSAGQSGQFFWVLPWLYTAWLPFLLLLPCPPPALAMGDYPRPFSRDTVTLWNTTDRRWAFERWCTPQAHHCIHRRLQELYLEVLVWIVTIFGKRPLKEVIGANWGHRGGPSQHDGYLYKWRRKHRKDDQKTQEPWRLWWNHPVGAFIWGFQLLEQDENTFLLFESP